MNCLVRKRIWEVDCVSLDAALAASFDWRELANILQGNGHEFNQEAHPAVLEMTIQSLAHQYGHSENPVSLKIESLLNHWHAHLMEWMDCGSPVEAAQYVLTVPLNKKVLGGLFWALGSDAREGFDCIRRRFPQRFQVFAARRLMVGCGFDVSK